MAEEKEIATTTSTVPEETVDAQRACVRSDDGSVHCGVSVKVTTETAVPDSSSSKTEDVE